MVIEHPNAALVRVAINISVRSLCIRPYAGHKRGCPNYGNKAGCPPAAAILGDLIELGEPVYAVYNAFDLGAHVARMKLSHPEWSERQLYCCLYWQSSARRDLRRAIVDFLLTASYLGLRRLVVVKTPEASGVDVTETMRSAGIELEWPPRRRAYQVALVGSAKGSP